MEGTETKAGAHAPAAPTAEVEGLEFTIDTEARASWDAIMMARDLNRLRERYQEGGEGAAEAALDAMALTMEYVLLVTDLTKAKISAHLGAKAPFDRVASFLAEVLQAATSKN